MSRPRKGDKAKDPSYQQLSIYLANDSHMKAKIVAAFKGENLRDFVGDHVEEYIEAEYMKVLEQQNIAFKNGQQKQYNEEIVGEQM